MYRRPWPIVVLATIQFLTPLGSLVFSALANKVSLSVMTKYVLQTSSFFEHIVFFVFPVLQAILILNARRLGYFVLLAINLYLIVANFMDWGALKDPNAIQMGLILVVNLIMIVFLAYLGLPRVRKVYFDSSIRWWETPLRYLMEVECRVIQTERKIDTFRIVDIALGGAGLVGEVGVPGLKIGAPISVEFRRWGHEYLFEGDIVWSRVDSDGKSRLGVRWKLYSKTEQREIRSLIGSLRAEKVPIVRDLPGWKEDFVSWSRIARRSVQAWVPEKNPKDPPRTKSPY